MENISIRFKLLIDSLKISQTNFAIKTNNSTQNISNVLRGKYQPSYTILYNTLFYIENLSAEWLILGRGEMFKGAENKVFEVKKELAPVEPVPSGSLEMYKLLLEEKDKRLADKEREIQRLEQMYKNLLSEMERQTGAKSA